MVTYASYPVFVDGVRLDSAAWGIEARTRTTAPVRPADVALPGVYGVTASLNDDLDQMTRTYSMWVLGTDADGNAVNYAQIPVLANSNSSRQLAVMAGIRVNF